MNTAATPIRFGREQYAQINANLNQACARSPFVIAAHRGTPRGDIRENTLNSVLATKQVNADIAEIDVIRSTDGEYFAFHDGTEMARLRITDDILSKTAAELDELRYTEYPGAYYGNVERVAHILSNAPDILINIDRSWRYWGSGFLDWLDQFHLESKLILKCPVTGGFQQALHDHDVKYMFMGMIQNPDELDLFVDDEQINTVGVELVATTEDTPLADPRSSTGSTNSACTRSSTPSTWATDTAASRAWTTPVPSSKAPRQAGALSSPSAPTSSRPTGPKSSTNTAAPSPDNRYPFPPSSPQRPLRPGKPSPWTAPATGVPALNEPTRKKVPQCRGSTRRTLPRKTPS